MSSCCLGLPVRLPRPGDLVQICAGTSTRPPTEASLKEDSASRLDQSNVLPRLETRPSAGRGLGLYAVDDIPEYTRLLVDDALISLARGEDLPQLWDKYCSLPPELCSVFDSLSYPSEMTRKEEVVIPKLIHRGYSTADARSMARINSRWQANAFAAEPNPSGSPSQSWSYSLFATVARINHSCAPNANVHYRPPGTEMVYALRPIKAGEEIEISYFSLIKAHSDRQQTARAWGFECTCTVCSIPDGPRRDVYEQLISRIRAAMVLQESAQVTSQAVDAAEEAIAIAQSADYPWLRAALPRLYLVLFNLKSAVSAPVSERRAVMEKAVEWEEKTTGWDSPTTIARRRNLRALDSI